MVGITIIILVVFFLGLLVGGLVWAVKEDAKDSKGPKQKEHSDILENVRILQNGFLEKQQEQKKQNLEKIMEMFVDNAELSNAEIREKLGLDDRTVVNYMDELEKQGKIAQAGKTGRYTYYKKG